MAWVKEKVGNSCKWTVRHSRRREKVRGTTVYQAPTVYSRCSQYFYLHSLFNSYGPTGQALSPFYR